MRALGVTGARSAHLPDVPSDRGGDVRGRRFRVLLFGMVAPIRGAAGRHSRGCTEAAAGAVKSDALNARLVEIGYVPVGSQPAEFGARIDTEIDKWTRIIQTANIKPTSTQGRNQ